MTRPYCPESGRPAKVGPSVLVRLEPRADCPRCGRPAIRLRYNGTYYNHRLPAPCPTPR